MPAVRCAAIPATLLALAMSACTGGAESSPDVSPSPGTTPAAATATPGVSAAPEQSHSEAGSATSQPSTGAGPIGPDAIVEVITTDLVIRTAPGTGPDSNILEPRLSEPQLLYVADGPVAADGYLWYLVEMFWMDRFPHGGETGGWIAAGGRDGEPWIAPTTLDCPTPTLEALAGMRELASLACYGGQTLTLEGNDGGCFQADPVTVSPGWLTHSGCWLNPDGYVEGVAPGPGRLVLRQAPGIVWEGYQPGTTARVVVTGHFDDPAARGCTAVGDDFIPQIPDLLVLTCRAQFVATEMRAAD